MNVYVNAQKNSKKCGHQHGNNIYLWGMEEDRGGRSVIVLMFYTFIYILVV